MTTDRKKQITDKFTAYILDKEKKLLGENPSPELTHVFRMGVYTTAKYFLNSLTEKIREQQGPIN